jgi:hypothetical protein
MWVSHREPSAAVSLSRFLSKSRDFGRSFQGRLKSRLLEYVLAGPK